MLDCVTEFTRILFYNLDWFRVIRTRFLLHSNLYIIVILSFSF